ncbi:MAG: hypothetical protein WCI05_16825, partial [Myxococcales bacterium]
LLASVSVPGMLFSVWPAFVESHRGYTELDAILPLIERQSAVLHFDGTIDTDLRHTRFNFVAAGARAVTVRGGRLHLSLTDSTVSAIRMAPQYRWDEPALRLLANRGNTVPSHDMTRFRYVLANSHSVGSLMMLEYFFSPEARLVAHSGQWLLFESTLPVVPITAPNVKLPRPRGTTVGERFNQLQEAEGRKRTGTAAP